MTTIQDNTLTSDPEAPATSVANGVHTRTRTPKVATPISNDPIARRQEATKELEAELETIRAREATILEELGIGKLVQNEKHSGGVSAATEAPKARRRTATRKLKPTADTKAAAKPRAKRTTTDELENEKAHVLGVLKRSDTPMSVSDVAEATALDSKNAARALKALREDKTIKSSGKARGTRYAAK